MKTKLLLFSILFLSVLAGCKKAPANENGNASDTPQHFEEDLSFTRTLEEVYYKYNGICAQEYKKISFYDGNKEVLYESYRDGELRTRWNNYVYNGLTCTYTISNSYSEVEAYEEFLDDTYSRPKYGETRTDEGISSKVVYEYDEQNRCIGVKRYSFETLSQETKDYYWDGLDCSCTTYYYPINGSTTEKNEHFTSYLDNTYRRPTHIILKAISFTGDTQSVTETLYQYDGKKVIGKQDYKNGVLKEEYKDYVYNGNRCSFKQLLYDNNGELVFEGEGYTVYYNP